MRILIATPLYPPEVAEPAPYAKELAQRLAKDHEVSVVAYAHLPEAIPGVRMHAVDKRRSRFVRLIALTWQLFRAARRADAVLVVNGASTELPALAVSYALRTPLFFVVADRAAHERAVLAKSALEARAFARAKHVFTELPLPRPEILPLDPEPTEELAAYEKSWEAHLALLANALHHDA